MYLLASHSTVQRDRRVPVVKAVSHRNALVTQGLVREWELWMASCGLPLCGQAVDVLLWKRRVELGIVRGVSMQFLGLLAPLSVHWRCPGGLGIALNG
jgi:hypothetical protein